METTYDAELSCLMPRDTGVFGPSNNRFVACICPAIAGFLVAPEGRNAVALAERLKDGHSIAEHDAERLAKGCEGLAEFDQTFRDKGPLPFRRIGPGPEFRLGDIER